VREGVLLLQVLHARVLPPAVSFMEPWLFAIMTWPTQVSLSM
jgi:hypothetical protein